MSLFILAYLAGIITIITPCILPILPLVAAQSLGAARRAPALIGLAAAFALVGSLGAVAADWAADANQIGRRVALVGLALFGVGLLSPSFAAWAFRPLVDAGARLARWAAIPSSPNLRSLASGFATGLIWSPCAGPILGLVLSGAVLHGPGLETTTLLFAFGLGAATALGVALSLGRRLLSTVRSSFKWHEAARRAVGAASLASVLVIALEIDTSLLQPLSQGVTANLENRLIDVAREPMSFLGGIAWAASMPPSPLNAIRKHAVWLNAAPMDGKVLAGRVVVVNFWTYSCINCLRALPYVKRWDARYGSQGLTVIGVHAPEFAFERERENVVRAIQRQGVRYPVVLDNDFRIWRAFRNSGWPATFVVAPDGTIAFESVGEGDYDRVEEVVRQLLAKRASVPAPGGKLLASQGEQMAADWASLRSPETYLGTAKQERFLWSGLFGHAGIGGYHHADKLPLNYWSLSGHWAAWPEYVALREAHGSIRYRFQARDLHLVMGVREGGPPVRFRIKIDGKAPAADRGADVDEKGEGVVNSYRLYQLARQHGVPAGRTLEIEFLDSGVQAYAFTFG